MSVRCASSKVFFVVDHRVSAFTRLWFNSGGVIDIGRREPPFLGRPSTQSSDGAIDASSICRSFGALIRDGNAIGGYHRRLRSTAPPELLDFSNVWRFPDRVLSSSLPRCSSTWDDSRNQSRKDVYAHITALLANVGC